MSSDGRSLLDRTSFFVFPWGKHDTSAAAMVSLAKFADEAGIDSVHLPYFTHLPAQRFGFTDWSNRSIFDVLAVAPPVARVTRRLRIGLSHWHFGLFHPFVWAQYLSSLDAVSQGRAMALPTANGYGRDMQIGRSDGADLALRTMEGTQLLRRLFDGEQLSTEMSTCWDVAGLRLNPAPKGPLPIWVHGHDEASLERARRWGGTVKVPGAPAEEIKNVIRPKLDAAAPDRRLELAPTYVVWISDPEDHEESRQDEMSGYMDRVGALHFTRGRNIISGTSEDVARAFRELIAAGADRFVLDFNFHGWETEEFAKEQIDRFRARVAPRI